MPFVHHLSRRRLLAAGLAGLLATAGASSQVLAPAADGRVNAVDGLGIGGYDPVAYFTRNAAVPGNAGIEAVHEGVTYRFSQAINRDAFLADPGRYLPQYGGYCAYAVARGRTAAVDPEAFAILDGRLFLNYDRAIREKWLADTAGYIAAADRNWPDIMAELIRR